VSTLMANRFQREAMHNWQVGAPEAYAALQDPADHFARLGTAAEQAYEALWNSMWRQQRDGDPAVEGLDEVGRVNACKDAAMEVIRGEWLMPPPSEAGDFGDTPFDPGRPRWLHEPEMYDPEDDGDTTTPVWYRWSQDDWDTFGLGILHNEDQVTCTRAQWLGGAGYQGSLASWGPDGAEAARHWHPWSAIVTTGWWADWWHLEWKRGQEWPVTPPGCDSLDGWLLSRLADAGMPLPDAARIAHEATSHRAWLDAIIAAIDIEPDAAELAMLGVPRRLVVSEARAKDTMEDDPDGIWSVVELGRIGTARDVAWTRARCHRPGGVTGALAQDMFWDGFHDDLVAVFADDLASFGFEYGDSLRLVREAADLDDGLKRAKAAALAWCDTAAAGPELRRAIEALEFPR